MAISISEVVAHGRSELSALTGLEVSSTLAVQMDDDGIYHLQVELVEKRSLPDGMDILASYEIQMDREGQVTALKRLGMRKRIDTDFLIEEEA